MNNKFLDQRQKFAEYAGFPELYEYIDQFPLYAGVHTIANKIFTYELLKMTVGVPGHIAEFGSWKGSNLLFLLKMMSLLEPHSGKKIIGFDNFAGLPAPSKLDGDYAVTRTGHYKGDLDLLKQAISLFDFEDRIELVVGDALRTIPEYRAAHKETMLSFCYLDFDLYEPTVKALEFIEEALVVGGVVVFDQALTHQWPGETLAWKEYLSKTNKKFRMISNTLSKQPTAAMIREA